MTVYKHKRTGKWIAQTPRDRITGKRKQVGSFRLEREAKTALAAELRRQPSTTTTVNEWRDRWLETPTWKESTRTHHRERTKRFAEAHGDKPIRAIDRTVARGWIALLPSSHQSLSAMFGAAAYEDDERGEALLLNNPFAKLVKRVVCRRDIQPDWMTNDDVEGLERVAVEVHGPHFGLVMASMIRFAAETGVRPGELFVLEDSDLVPAIGRMWVRRGADSKNRIVTTPKNGKTREIVLSTRAHQAVGGMPRIEGQPRLFSTPTGRQFWLPGLTYHWKPVRAAAGRPGMDFYELRHYCATRLLEQGLDYPDVAIQLGHEDGGELVRRTYGHPSRRRALDRVQGKLDGEAEAA